jgi:hypothetical protein
MKMLTTSVYTFENLIEGNFQYVDKTAYICELLKPAFAQYFLSRPRHHERFLPNGKPIHLIGANFDTQARNISEWLSADAPGA